MGSPAFNVEPLENRLGYTFERRELLVLALTHPSWEQEQKSRQSGNNQRLEFLGDSVLNLVISEFLYKWFPSEPEGFLTRNRAALVRGKILFRLAEELDLENHLRIGKSELNSGKRGRDSRLEDALEAIIGAIYLDSGLEDSTRVILRLIGDPEKRIQANLQNYNAKGRFQERIQESGGTTEDVKYQLLKKTGPDHNLQFHVQLSYQGRPLGEGRGRSRKEAENEAAARGLQTLSASSPEAPEC